MTKNAATPPNFPRPLTTVDVVIFTALDERLHVLLVKRPEGPKEPFPGRWALPGGFVNVERDMTLEECALRKLKEKTGLDAPYLEQLGSWGSATRDPRAWSATHVYFALLPHASVHLRKDATEVEWFPVTDTGVKPNLAFDHALILAAAIERLRSKAEYTSLPAYLLPETFTLSELQRAYEVVLGRPVDKSAFRTRVFSAQVVEESSGMRTGPNRPAQLYRIKAPGKLAYFPRTFSPRND
jgi:ADP-ribose pyrophosphatase YjhB (NUDIX family)